MADGSLQFLVDTGDQVSVLQPEQLPAGAKVNCAVVPQLAAANGSTIMTVFHTDHVVTLMGAGSRGGFWWPRRWHAHT